MMMSPDKFYNRKTSSLLYRLGVPGNYTGFLHVSYAINLVMEKPEYLSLVTKWLYPEVARHYSTTWHDVERNIRSVITLIWTQNPQLLSTIAQTPLNEKPKPAQFIFFLAMYLSENSSVENNFL